MRACRRGHTFCKLRIFALRGLRSSEAETSHRRMLLTRKPAQLAARWLLLLGLARAAATAVTCYEGDVASIGSDFFNSSMRTCRGAACVEKRWKDWETAVGVLQLFMSCGDCSLFDKRAVECRECSSNLCNSEFAAELLAEGLANYRLCYASVGSGSVIRTEPVRCPRNQRCATGCDPCLSRGTLTGCEAHCQKLGWINCRYCDADLCNNASSSDRRSATVASDLRAPVSRVAAAVRPAATARCSCLLAALLLIDWLRK